VRIEQLEYLTAVTRHGSLRRASEQLHLSQPALSEGLRNLERELGVTLLDRRRSGARISRDGKALLPGMVEILEAVDRLRSQAGHQRTSARTVHVGTVNAGTSHLLVPALRDFHEAGTGAAVEVVTSQQAPIAQAIAEGSLDLGLVNALPGDDQLPELGTTVLLRGDVVVCCHAEHPLAQQEAVTLDDLRLSTLVGMRSGYLMHRFLHRVAEGDPPTVAIAADGAEMGKLLVAEGLGVTVLPDYSIDSDPLVKAGVITYRPLVGVETEVSLLMLHAAAAQPPAVRLLMRALAEQAERLADEAQAEEARAAAASAATVGGALAPA
jgi:DNA-binding transcriptional LysR family regulator